MSTEILCGTCGRDNRNLTHTALEQTGHLGHPFAPPQSRGTLSKTILDDIAAEFASAYEKHGGLTPRSWSVGDRESLVILVEEVGEVARAMTYDEGDADKLVDELIQVAAMAAAWAERLMIRGDA